MSKKYFSPVAELDEPVEGMTAQPEKCDAPFPTDFSAWIPRVNQEIRNLADGSSALRFGGLQMTGNVPVLAAWNRFQESKSKDHLKSFFKLARQDFGVRVRVAMWLWLLESRPEMALFKKEFQIE